MNIRKATFDDIPKILAIIDDAKALLKSLKIDQWQNGYPNQAQIENDIKNNESYVVLNDENQLMATTMFSTNGEPTYKIIEGNWLIPETEKYGVIHRLATKKEFRKLGIAQFVFDYFHAFLKEQNIQSLKIDTHQENLGMQTLVKKLGYQYCGIIKTSYGDERLAFEKIITEKYSYKILDCESLESILSSLSGIYKTTPNDIMNYFKNVNFEKIWEKSLKNKYGYELLFDDFKNNFIIDKSIKIRAYWFHNTRVLKGTNFEEGILPLERAIEKVENCLSKVIENLNLSVNKDKLMNSNTTSRKLKSDYDQGPWGFLIRDFAFEKIEGIHDYLAKPELVEDIIRFRFPKKYDLILKEYQKITTKCIVKFKSDREFHPETLTYIINYLYHKTKNIDMDYNCNTNISNFGNIIPANMILSINYYD